MAGANKPLEETSLAKLRFVRPPFWLVSAAAIMVVLTWLPLAIIVKARFSKSEKPRIHIFQDMDNQPKLKAQAASLVFADGRANRLRVPGAVGRGQLKADDHLHRGYAVADDAEPASATFLDGLPAQISLTDGFVRRGQQRFIIYCAPCHGEDGYGNGPVNARAIELQQPMWVPAASLHSDTVRGRADGHLFNTISNGIRNMAGYGSQIPVEDRWAIVAYIRALQLSQQAPPSMAPDHLRADAAK